MPAKAAEATDEEFAVALRAANMDVEWAGIVGDLKAKSPSEVVVLQQRYNEAMSELLDSLKVRAPYGRMYASSAVLLEDYKLIDHLPEWSNLTSFKASSAGAISSTFEEQKKTVTTDKWTLLDRCMG